MNHHPSAWGQTITPHQTFDLYSASPIVNRNQSGGGYYSAPMGVQGEEGFLMQGQEGRQHTQSVLRRVSGLGSGVEIQRGMRAATDPVQPLVTGTSVLGIQFEGGIMLAADNLASYGSLARFKDIQRLYPLYSSSSIHPSQSSTSQTSTAVLSDSAPAESSSDNKTEEVDVAAADKKKKSAGGSSHTCLAVAGDMSDFQYLKKVLEGVITKERAQSTTDAHPALAPEQIYEYLSNIMYARRSKLNPLWNAIVLGGVKDGKSFLGYVDLQGTTYQAPTLATGFASHFAQPLLREAYERRQEEGRSGAKQGELLSREEAEAVLDTCMKVLFYRDARSMNKYQIATITDNGIDISPSKENQTEWKFAEGLRGYGPQKQ